MLNYTKFIPVFTCLVFIFSSSLSGAVYQDLNGLVVIEAENLTGQTANWKQETTFTAFSGNSYIRWNGSNNFSNPGSGVISTTIQINNPGVYRVMLRNKVGYGTSTTEHNDTWVKFPGVTEFYGKKGTHKVYPKGSGKTPNPEGASKDGWLKVYCHGTTAWSWRAKTNDKDPYEIFVEFAAVGEYHLSLSGRSQHHCVDRIVLFNNNVVESYATDLTRNETLLDAEVSVVSRIAILADGNSPDPDDIGATAVSLAILRALKAEKRLVYYAHSCDLVRNNTKITEGMELQRQALMQASCEGTAEKWGGFEHVTFYNCRTQQDLATGKLRDAINESTAASPLAIIEAGEPDVIYDAIAAADSAKRKFVSIITHHLANDESADDPNKNLSNILNDFSAVKEERIPDQNTELQTPIEEWDWAKNHPDERITWLYNQGKIAEQDNVVGFQKGKFDCSDAGMVYYQLTGEKSPTVTLLKDLFNNYVGFEFKPHVVPGKIQFEDYNLGGNEVGYFDHSIQDLTQYSYRANDLVDLGRNGSVVSAIETGEWLEYTIDVEQSGFYKLSVNHSTTAIPSVNVFSVIQTNNEDTLIGGFECYYTGRGSYFFDEVGEVLLKKGEQVLRFLILNAGVDLDYFELEFISSAYQVFTAFPEHGEIIVSPEQDFYANNEEITITAIPDEGYSFKSWLGEFSDSENPLILKINNTDVNVDAIFEITTNVEQTQLEQIKVYPNPNNGRFNIQLPKGKQAQFKLFKLDGALITKGEFDSSIMVENLNLSSGFYFLEVKSGNGIHLSKILVE